MGYSTDFLGELTLSKHLTDEQFEHINKMSDTRRMKRDVAKLMEMFKGKHGYPGTSIESNTPEEIYGNEGEFFVGGTGHAGQDSDESILDYNEAPGAPTCGRLEDFNKYWNNLQKTIKEGKCQPGLWCQWNIEKSDDSMVLIWDGTEKFYNYVEWLQYYITNFFSKWGVMLNGTIEWTGEDSSDIGRIIVKDNKITIKKGKVVYS